ncbi:MAG: T9SS type A sorting domain-containing protein [Crocinitomicaceae bacterium]|nr:T9SS type A sorting domain-containing protein [Crocinitomicaceae bacterium]
MKITFTLFLCAFGLISWSQDIWTQADSINGAPRTVASAFVVDGEGYAIGGLDQSGFRRKMYSYTFIQNDWDDEPSIGGDDGGGLNRGSACAFSINNKGYVCLGQGQTNPFFKDLWEFDENTNAWTQKADFAGSERRQAVAFTINSLAYVGTGYDATGYVKDMYKYSAETNTWTQISDFGGTARKEAVGFSMGDQGYVGTGDDGVLRNDFWQYEPTTDMWIQKADFPGTKRKGAAAWGIFPQAFICMGEDINSEYKRDLWEYNYFSDTWVQRSDYGGPGRSGAIAFVLQGVAFVGSGYNGNFNDDMYSYRKLASLEDHYITSNTKLYPNPSNGTFKLDINSTDLELEVYSLMGQIVTDQFQIEKTSGGFELTDIDNPAGNYLIKCYHPELGQIYQSKIVLL